MVTVGLFNKKFRTKKINEQTGDVEEISFWRRSIEVAVEMPWGFVIFKSTRTHRGWGRWKDSRPGTTLRRQPDYDNAQLFNEVKRIAGVDSALDAICQVRALQV